MKKKGFTLVELMVVIAIIAILAAVALPIYSTFKMKSRASTAVKGAMGSSQAIMTYFDESFDFSTVVMDPAAPPLGDGAKLVDGAGQNVGTGLPGIDGVTWTSITSGDAGTETSNVIAIAWTHEDCPAGDCDGVICIACYTDQDACEIAVDVNVTSNEFGLDKGDLTVCP